MGFFIIIFAQLRDTHKLIPTRGSNTPEWAALRFDIDARVLPDLVGTMTDMSAVPDASVDAIFSSHNLEHLYPHEVPQALREFLRVLRPEGFAVITCPDLRSVCQLVAADQLTETAYQSPAGPIAPIDILYGHRASLARGNLYMAHRCGFAEKMRVAILQGAGFSALASKARGAPHFDLWALASKSPCEEPLASKSPREEQSMRALVQTHFPR